METRTNSRNQNIELGRVSWLRDYDDALGQSELTGKPVILFFRKFPDVLHALILEGRF